MTLKTRTEYALNDLISISKGEKSQEEIALKYGVSVNCIRKAMSRRGLRSKSLPVLAHYNGEIKKFHSANECANKIGVARQTIVRALQGKRTVLDKLDIKVEVYYGEEEYYY